MCTVRCFFIKIYLLGEKLHISYVKFISFSTVFPFSESKKFEIIFLGHILGKVNNTLEQSQLYLCM